MRFIIFLLLIFSLLSAYDSPPFYEVETHNQASISSIRSTLISAGPLNEPDTSDPIIYANAKPITLDPSVDNRISSSQPPKLLWTWAENHADTVIEEWEDDGCNNDIELNFASYTLNGTISFTFRNITKYTSFDEGSDESSFFLTVPFTSSELDQTNGSNFLEIEINGVFNFMYDKDEHYSWRDENDTCESDDYHGNETFVKSFSSKITYLVEGGNLTFFLNSPALREQWYKNNKFDTIVLSKRKLYKANVLLNGEKVSNSQFYSFSVSEDEYEIQHIDSTESKSGNMDSKESLISKTPPIQKDDIPQKYAYSFDSSYSGEGWNSVSLLVYDHFENSYKWNEDILSRKLSFDGNTTEEGEPYDKEDETVRPSIPFNIDEINPIIASIGILGVFIIIILNRRKN